MTTFAAADKVATVEELKLKVKRLETLLEREKRRADFKDQGWREEVGLRREEYEKRKETENKLHHILCNPKAYSDAKSKLEDQRRRRKREQDGNEETLSNSSSTTGVVVHDRHQRAGVPVANKRLSAPTDSILSKLGHKRSATAANLDGPFRAKRSKHIKKLCFAPNKSVVSDDHLL